MPVVNIYMWSGRTDDQKRRIAKGITEVFESEAGVPKEAMHVVFHDISKNNWAIAGELCSDSE